MELTGVGTAEVTAQLKCCFKTEAGPQSYCSLSLGLLARLDANARRAPLLEHSPRRAFQPHAARRSRHAAPRRRAGPGRHGHASRMRREEHGSALGIAQGRAGHHARDRQLLAFHFAFVDEVALKAGWRHPTTYTSN
ncbi:hypothetical protein PsYK624_168240 [Phanerochaete sordida]|uniref:Uncharacterized protein n=1 Tax=Phanerochaete sordida TaxID=48140 RepID=A0A9P3GT64_9APHY|nr:hypothetical protein PsYK624_168240 [Phanerochaete sordida]